MANARSCVSSAVVLTIMCLLTSTQATMQQLSLRTSPRTLRNSGDVQLGVSLFWLINGEDFPEEEYEKYEDYMDALQEEFGPEIDGDADQEVGAESDGEEDMMFMHKFTEDKLYKFRGDLLDAQYALRDCEAQLGMIAEIQSVPWGEKAPEAAEEDGEEWDLDENDVPVRKAMRTGYFDQLQGGLEDGVEKLVDIRKLWCLDESAARLGQSEAELVKSLLTAHATDLARGGQGILYESKRPGHDGDQPGIKEIKEMLDAAFERKITEQTARKPILQQREKELEAEVDRLSQMVQNRKREQVAEIEARRKAHAAEDQERYNTELKEFWEQEKIEQAEADRKHQAAVAAKELERKNDLDAKRKAAFAARYGAQ